HSKRIASAIGNYLSDEPLTPVDENKSSRKELNTTGSAAAAAAAAAAAPAMGGVAAAAIAVAQSAVDASGDHVMVPAAGTVDVKPAALLMAAAAPSMGPYAHSAPQSPGRSE